MISQTTVQPTGTSMASPSVSIQPSVNGGVWAGLKAAIRFGVVPLFQSLHPDYIPSGVRRSAQPEGGPAFTIGSTDGQSSSFFQGIGPGARLLSSFTVLPAEVSTLLEGFETLFATARLKDQLEATTAPASGQSQVDGSASNDKDKKKTTPHQERQRASPPAAAMTGQLPKAAVALVALSGMAATGAASPANNKTDRWNAVSVGKIDHNPDYPLNGTPVNAAPLEASPGNSATANIALWATAFVVAGVAGVCIYHHCLRRSCSAGDPQEVMTINTVGQAQREDNQPMIEAFRREAGEETAGEQRRRIPPPKPYTHNKSAVPEPPPIPARSPFLEELRNRVTQPMA
ncbi:hypothetical protein, partial [Endozoicomonas sp. ONNA2]|uniref:hypothetical protein n=1 Tax=Endozoicomonas sp. ONNA2 TaxID=2828741 RepID=UPI00214765CD